MSYPDDYEDFTLEQDVECKLCGAEDLTWYNTGTADKPRWELFAQLGSRLAKHVCVKRTDDGGFEDEDR